jgi:xanthine dehydrogenase accessory factor
MQDQNGTRWLIDPCFANHRHVMLFGAGHVGASLVRALGELPCNITWIDEREDMFPASMPNNVTTEATDTPETFVDHAPAGTFFLVMTHSHALDQRLAECILRRADIGWFGLIGSLTKRRQFEHRLRERGIDDARLAHMTCPIGIDGINGKEPAVIAASVCAQLLCLWDKGLETISRKNSQCNPMP